MAKSDKDKTQKEKSIRFCICNNIIPFIEVDVINVKEISDTETCLTDIDVLGVEVLRNNHPIRIVFDCKTLAKTSPINRSFWAAGVMQYINSKEAFVILDKKALEAHRLSAASLNVHLFDINLFDKYSESININYLDKRPYSYNINNWYTLSDAYNNNTKLKILYRYLSSVICLDDDYSKCFRHIISNTSSIKGELDPDKNIHMAVYSDIIFGATFVLASISNELSKVFDPALTKLDYEKILRYYLWGGKESYKIRLKLSEAASAIANKPYAAPELPKWDELAEVIRTLLESPINVIDCCIPLKEVSLRYLVVKNIQSDIRLSEVLHKSNRIRQFIFKISSYIANASGLPKEFHLNLVNTINELMSA